METFVLNSVVQAGGLSPQSWDALCRFWQWAFWIGFFVGVAGTVVCLFMNPIES